MASQNELAFRKWWWLVVVAAVIGTAGAFGALQVVKPEYQATCRLFVAGRPDSGTGEGYQAAQFAQARVAAYLDLIKGARVAKGALDALHLDTPTEDLQGRISASAAAESVIMSVSVVDQQPQRSADLANAVCQAFISVAADAEGANPLVNVRVIEYANRPLYAVGPSQKRYLAVGALTGLFVGLGLVVALGRLRPGKRPTSEAATQGAQPAGPVLPGRVPDDSRMLTADDSNEQPNNTGFHRRQSL